MDVLLLHKHPELINQCCDLINAEWPRSRTARLRGIECSCDKLPTCLVLVQKGEGSLLHVIGHSKISPIPSIPTGGFVESVVIHHQMRGKGLGRLLMQRTEEFMKSIGLTESYLSTYDQQVFYTKLGYNFSERVCIYGQSISNIFQRTSNGCSTRGPDADNNVKILPPVAASSAGAPLPPPPPPMPQASRLTKAPNNSTNLTNGEKPKKDFMKKFLI